MSTPIAISDVRILAISEGRFGLLLTIETQATREDFSRLIVRRRGCHISCQFPGSEQRSRMYGDIFWVEPRATAGGTIVRFGVSLDQSDPSRIADLRSYLASLPWQTDPCRDSAARGGADDSGPVAAGERS